MTTYDEVYKHFISISKTDGFNLPDTNEKIYDKIHAAVRKFNNLLRDNLGYDDTLEQFDRDLTNDNFIVMVNILKLIFLENSLVYYTTLFSGFTKEVGIKNYNATVRAKQYLVELQEKRIESLISNSEDEIVM